VRETGASARLWCANGIAISAALSQEEFRLSFVADR
jgi:hypothetical protein